MENTRKGKKSRKKFVLNLVIIIVILTLIVGLPLSFLKYQAERSGTTVVNVLKRITGAKSVVDTVFNDQSAMFPVAEKIDFLDPMPVGNIFSEPPMISNLAVGDLDSDGLKDIIVCDARGNFVSCIRQYPAGIYTESIIGPDLLAPAHAQLIDFDGDGDNDILVALLGVIFPSNDKIGSVVILENDGNGNFIKHIAAEKIARVSDVRAGDLDGDGDMDLAVAQFGYDDGETRWIENLGNWQFKSHILQNLSGPVNIEILDLDDDGDLDLISLVTQEWEQIFCFINDGRGNFKLKLLWGSTNEDFGSSGIFIADLNQDGREDILYTNGDAFDYIPPRGRPWHGVQWFENRGELNFEFHRLTDFVGAFSPRSADVDNDGDLDVFAVSGFNLWEKPDAQSFIWLENTGGMNFIKRFISNSPTHIITLETGDFNNDGLIDFVTGGMHVYKPFDRMGRVTLWMNNGNLQKIR